VKIDTSDRFVAVDSGALPLFFDRGTCRQLNMAVSVQTFRPAGFCVNPFERLAIDNASSMFRAGFHHHWLWGEAALHDGGHKP
jgi:hypothetical protein